MLISKSDDHSVISTSVHPQRLRALLCGREQDHDVYKRRLDQRGAVIPDSVEKHKVGPEQDENLLHKGNETECGSCYGAGTEEECCNTCDEVLLLQLCHPLVQHSARLHVRLMLVMSALWILRIRDCSRNFPKQPLIHICPAELQSGRLIPSSHGPDHQIVMGL